MRQQSQDQLNLFAQASDAARQRQYWLVDQSWPAAERFPVTWMRASTRAVVWPDLVGATDPLVVAGYSSLTELIDLVSAWLARHEQEGTVRVLFGSEPFPTARRDFSARAVVDGFSAEMRQYWLEEQHVSLAQSARILQTIDALERGRVEARCLPNVHAKVYIGADAATVGSSNFTATGLGPRSEQIEVNSRFSSAHESRRYRELVGIAENYWAVGMEFGEQLGALLRSLLQVESWPEALARAAGELLEGEWARRYLPAETTDTALWPAQRAGIAQALWVINNVGGVLLADATGSGKTRVGAHVIRAVRDWLWRTGRVRNDQTTVVCPPGAVEQWDRETLLQARMSVHTVSHGRLSQPDAGTDLNLDKQAVAGADILAVDEAHNFLQRSERTRQLQDSGTGHKLLFTATPINRGREDLLQLVNLLGADNFDDDTIAILRRLNSPDADRLTQAEQDRLRHAIGRFTVRRTKTMLNALVDRNPEAYRHPQTGRICRYPHHHARSYATGETADDAELAARIRQQAEQLRGVAWLGADLTRPAHLPDSYSDAALLESRLRSAQSLARYQVIAALRSSRAALVEHLHGTQEAARHFLHGHTGKLAETGNTSGKLHRWSRRGRPPAVMLECPVPDWLTTPEGWIQACQEDIGRYQEILTLVADMSPSRERTKAAHIAALHPEHPRLLAFDWHLITLRVLAQHLSEQGMDPIIADATASGRRAMARRFAPEAAEPAVALCSDAFNESFNLQGASALVHLDLPTTVRWAEQRVGRLDRMDSPHTTVDVWWPHDGPAFATSAYEKLAARLEETASLLGGNLEIPTLGTEHDEPAPDDETPIDTAQHITTIQGQVEQRARDWDGLRDALAPVRDLVTGADALVPNQLYEQYRDSHHRVLARISPVRTRHPWAFFAVTGSSTGAPYWILLDQLDEPNPDALTDLEDICRRLRTRLADNPERAELDEHAVTVLEHGFHAAAHAEHQLLPTRMRRALAQMRTVTHQWSTTHVPTAGDESGPLYQRLAELARTVTTTGDTPQADPYIVAERWLSLLRPYLDEYRRTHRRHALLRITDITQQLVTNPPPTQSLMETFDELPAFIPVDHRATACILGVPPSTPLSPAPRPSRA